MDAVALQQEASAGNVIEARIANGSELFSYLTCLEATTCRL